MFTGIGSFASCGICHILYIQHLSLFSASAGSRCNHTCIALSGLSNLERISQLNLYLNIFNYINAISNFFLRISVINRR